MSEPKHKIPANVSRSMESSGVEVAGHREIAYGTQYRLARGGDTANLNVYQTGKIWVDGKDTDLKRLVNSWRPSNGKSRNRIVGKNPKARTSPSQTLRHAWGPTKLAKENTWDRW